MDKSLDELMEKVKGIKQEMDKVEFRVLNTKTHVEVVEKSMEKIGKEIIEGFHIVSNKVNRLEEEIKRVEILLEELVKK
jgi:predicted  nucleic acid-binding Zn-ribbon protein